MNSDPEHSPEILHRTSIEICAKLQELAIDACVIGGIALQRWSNPRMTTDVELTAMVGFGREAEIARTLTTFFRHVSSTPRLLRLQIESYC